MPPVLTLSPVWESIEQLEQELLRWRQRATLEWLRHEEALIGGRPYATTLTAEPDTEQT